MPPALATTQILRNQAQIHGLSLRLGVEVCALSALCVIWVGFGGVRAGFRFLCFGPETCGPSSAGGGFPVGKAEFEQLFESEVDSFLAYVAMKETPDLNSA